MFVTGYDFYVVKLLIFKFIIMYMCVFVWVEARKVLDPLELMLKASLGCPKWTLRNDLWSLRTVVCSVKC